MTTKHDIITQEVFAKLVEIYESTFAKHNYTNLLAMANRDPSTSAASFRRIRERVISVCKRRFEPVLQDAGIVIDLDVCFKLVEEYTNSHTQRLDAVN
jgi:hypothetical protein